MSNPEPIVDEPPTDFSSGETAQVSEAGPSSEEPTSNKGGHQSPESATHRPIRSFIRRNRDDLIRDALVGTILAALAFGGASWWDSRLAERQQELEAIRFLQQEVLENVRFVRQVVIDGAEIKPFKGLNLRDAELGGLDLGCGGEDSGAVACANFTFANLTDANLIGTNLQGANLEHASLAYAFLSNANLTNANLTGADLREVDLYGANLTGADLTLANLRGANLSNTDLRGANLSAADARDVCFGPGTRWPTDDYPVPTTDPLQCLIYRQDLSE